MLIKNYSKYNMNLITSKTTALDFTTGCSSESGLQRFSLDVQLELQLFSEILAMSRFLILKSLINGQDFVKCCYEQFIIDNV